MIYIYIYIYIYKYQPVLFLFQITSTNLDEDFQLNQKFMLLLFDKLKNNFDKIFLFSDKTLLSKRIGRINESPNIYLSAIF